MKRKHNPIIALLPAMILITVTASAQTSLGTFSLGGALTFGSNNYKSDGNEVVTTDYQFAPSFGYFVNDNLMLGAVGTVAVGRDKFNNGNTKRLTYALGPFMRYYKFTSNEQFAFFGEIGFSFGGGRRQFNDNEPTKSGSFNMYLAPGFTWFPTKHWGVDLTLNLLSFTAYDPDKDTDGDNGHSYTFGLNTFNTSIGVRYYF